MADKTVTVNPIGGDYATLALAIAGELVANSDLTAGGLDGILTISIEGDWSGGPDTTAVVVDGFTTDATHYLLIETNSANRALKTGWSTSRYRLELTDDSCITVQDDHVRINGLQIRVTFSAVTFKYGIFVDTIGVTNAIHIYNNRININGGITYGGIALNDGDMDALVFNNIIFGESGSPRRGIFCDVNTLLLYNNIIYGIILAGGEGVDSSSGSTTTVKNCAVFNNSNDFDGTFSTIDYCASDDGDGTNSQAPSGSNWDNEFSDPANGNFTLLNTGNLYTNGVGPSADSNVPTPDIDGTARSGATCDIGIDEYAAVGGIAIPVVMNHMRRMVG